MQYYERLRDVREDLDLKQSTVAKAIGTTQQQIYKYEKGIQEMTASRLKQFCEYYNVSADFV